MLAQSILQRTYDSLTGTWAAVYSFIPTLIGALIVLAIGLIVAFFLGSLVERIIRAAKLDNLLRKIGFAVYVERAGYVLDSGKFFGKLVYWFFVVVFVLAVSNILGLEVFSGFLSQILLYLPNIIIATLILLATLVVARFLKSLVKASVMGAKLHAPKFLGSFTWWVVIFFGFITALLQLGINVFVFQALVIGLIAMLALAGGIALGMGGKEYASHLIDKFRRGTEE